MKMIPNRGEWSISTVDIMEWKFRTLGPAETNQNPAHVNFFRDDNEASEVASFVREDIQNRLDARPSGCETPVRVRYRVHRGSEGLDWEARKPWMESLREHAGSQQVQDELIDEIPSQLDSMDYFVAEDFNTTGLRGDWHVKRDDEIDPQAEKNDFYWFVRNVGRSKKTGSDRGRWGLGKIVYPACSRIRSFFAYSVRASDGQAFLTGRSVLPIHQTKDGTWVDSEGYFGNFDSDCFCLPVDDNEHLTQFVDTFKISRGAGEAGTSLVIPFVVKSISTGNLIEFVIKSYFWELIQGNLVVEVDSSEGTTTISKDTLTSVIEKFESPTFDSAKMKELCEFSNLCERFDKKSDQFITLGTLGSLNWLEGETWFTEDQLSSARTSFLDGELLCFEIPVIVKPKGRIRVQSHFHVYLQSDSDLKTTEEHFIRDGLTISGQKMLRSRGIRSLVVAEHRNLADLLGDSENPSHTRWVGANVKGKYANAAAIVSFVKNASTRLVNLMTGADEERDDDLLASVFGLPLDSPPKNTRRGPKKKKVLPPKPNPTAVDTPFYALEPFKGGFQFRTSPKDTNVDTRDFTKLGIRVRCAYDGTKNPLKDHSPFDFDLSDSNSILIEASDCDAEFVSANEIRFLPKKKEFIARLTGFDSNRDLLIKTDKIKLDADDEDESNDSHKEVAL